MNDSPAMSGALEDLEESLQRTPSSSSLPARRGALSGASSAPAGDLSKQLRRVKDDFLNKVMLASFAVNTQATIVLLTIQAAGGGGHPPPRQPEVPVPFLRMQIMIFAHC
jgi:L1 cell adhesion molecule like protein